MGVDALLSMEFHRMHTLPHFRFLPVFPLAVGFLQDSEGPKSDLQLLLPYSYPYPQLL